jgi:hypothetical protein
MAPSEKVDVAHESGPVMRKAAEEIELEEQAEHKEGQHGDVEQEAQDDGPPEAVQLHWNTYAVVGSCSFGILATIVT